MKNAVIMTLANALAGVSANKVDAADAYKILKWKSELTRAAKAVDSQRQALVRECFTDEERALAADPKSEKSEEVLAKIGRFNQLFSALMEDETEVAVKTVRWSSWHQLCADNDLHLGALECELEGVLFRGEEE